MKTLSSMKICLLTDAWLPWWGGGQKHIWEISKILRKKYGCQVDIVVPNLADNKEVVSLGPRFIFPNIFGRLFFTFNVFLYCLKNNYDIYHSHSYSTSLFLPLIKFFKKKKIVFTLHGMGTLVLGAEFVDKLKIADVLNKFVVYKIKYDALITVAKQSLTEKTNTSFVTVIGNGVNLKKYDEIRGGKKGGTFNLLWVGRMVPVKGLFLLLLVFSKLAVKYPKLRLKLVGDSPEKPGLELVVKKLKLQNKVFFVGKILEENELIKEYKQADLFILPSVSAEGFPVTIVEAMAAKLPVIASDIGDTSVLVNNGKTGYLIKPGDKKDLFDKLEKLINNFKRAEMGKLGYNLVKEKYTWDLITKEIYEVYCEILK